MHVEISSDDGWSPPSADGEDGVPDHIEARIRDAVDAALAAAGVGSDGEVSVHLTGDARIAALNAEYRGKSGATNVLSFPADRPDAGAPVDGRPVLLGDIVLACQTIAREAAEQRKTFANHLCHLVVHGVLHLVGFDHTNDDEAAEMERIEIAALASLTVPNPYD